MDALLIKGWMQSATIQVGCGIKNTQSITSRQSESFRQSKRERAAVCEILSDMCGINNATFNVLPPSDAPFEQVLRNRVVWQQQGFLLTTCLHTAQGRLLINC